MRRASRARERGAVLVEYALLITFFAIPVLAGLTAGGARMLASYQKLRTELLQPFP
jgi:Flp pilus assembly pilin Flp